ncbi:MAG: hypothetical protein RLZZ129_1984 [Verrucomicrobiota bacterium]|jgi:hypothetical protein
MTPTPDPQHSVHSQPPFADDDTIDLRELWLRVLRGLPKTVGLGLLGLAVGATAYFAAGPFLSVSTATRVVFSFSGYERGEYPDRSKFQADDLRAPEIISEALKRQGLDDSEGFQSQVRAALSIEGIIPPNIVKERDRQRAAGQTVAPYRPDEYTVSLSLPRKFPLGPRQREQLLNEITNVYRERFQQTYVSIPLNFGNAFKALEGADYFDYELILSRENHNIAAFLSGMNETARSFRSPRTNLSFGDLHKQSQLFSQIRLNETLGLIRQYGLSKDRLTAMIKMDYYLQSLEDQERRAVEEENLVLGLLRQAQERTQGQMLGIKSQSVQQRPDTPLIDQGLIDSLLANDAYNFLVRRALEIGLQTRQIQSEKAVLLERRRNMQAFIEGNRQEQTEMIAQLERSLAELSTAYAALFANIRTTHEDYERQQFADAIRISMQATTGSFYRGFAKAGIVGLAVGLAAGFGLSLLGVTAPRRN